MFCPDGEHSWMNSHAQVPRLIEREAELEILFATRSRPADDATFVSRIGSVRVDRRDPTRVVSVCPEPVFDVGGRGQFDEFGVMPGCVVSHGQRERLYYTGWSRPDDAPYQTFIGLAERDRNGTFLRRKEGPVLGPTPNEPILCNGPFIVESAGLMHMFYASAIRWIDHGGRHECEYRIAHATSTDGLDWDRDGRFIIPTMLANECQNAPTVVEFDSRFHMWFCYREALDFRNSARGYRLAYAWSEDLLTWHRDDVSPCLIGPADAWEQEMQCYPGVYLVDNKWWMFYCGNYFGRSGFGCADLQYQVGESPDGQDMNDE